jgi:hypothetical protein
MSHHIHIERIPQTLIPMAFCYTLGIVVGQALQTFALDVREFADLFVVLDECRGRRHRGCLAIRGVYAMGLSALSVLLSLTDVSDLDHRPMLPLN